MLHLILFLIFGAICVGGAINLLTQHHPIDSALSLVVVMASLAVEYLLLGAEFVAGMQVIVYAGAIIGGVLIAWVLLHRVNAAPVSIGAQPGDPRDIARILFHDFLLPFEITSILIMIAILGAVVLASRPEAVVKRPSADASKGAPELVGAGKEH